MKKISIILLLMFGTISLTIAQVTAPPAKATVVKQDKATIAAQKKAAKDAKALAKMQAKETKVTPAPTAARLNNNGTPDKRFSANKQAAAPVAPAVRLNKNGTPDKRFSANKPPKVTPQVVPQVQPTQTMQAKPIATPAKVTRTTVAHTTTVKTADKVLTTDAKGRTIYQGPRGGKYYIDKNGNKEYIK